MKTVCGDNTDLNRHTSRLRRCGWLQVCPISALHQFDESQIKLLNWAVLVNLLVLFCLSLFQREIYK